MEKFKLIGLECKWIEKTIVVYLLKMRIVIILWQLPKNSLSFYYFSISLEHWNKSYYGTIFNICFKEGEFCFITRKGIHKRVNERFEFVDYMLKNKKIGVENEIIKS